jgi:ferredoxin
MKAIVDEDACTACGLCEDTCPEVLELRYDVAVVLVDTVPDDQEDLCRQAAEECPAEAIAIEE